MEIKNVTVSGTGLMGTQIAMQIALHGYQVTAYDVFPAQLENAKSFSDNWFAKRIQSGKMDDDTAAAAQANLRFSSDIREAAGNADMIIDAVPDILDIKISSLKALDEYAPAHCIYASNSSYIVSSRFCHAVKDPSHVLNAHFFNPALVMKIVEVVKGPHVSQETFDMAFRFVESIGKTPIKIEKEIYGFVVNRIFSALTREACYLVDAGIAAPEAIDTAVKGALGHAMGPLETLDMTGLDLEYHVYMERFKASGNKADLPAACLTEHYAKGEYGRKTGRGFYEYGNAKEKKA